MNIFTSACTDYTIISRDVSDNYFTSYCMNNLCEPGFKSSQITINIFKVFHKQNK